MKIKRTVYARRLSQITMISMIVGAALSRTICFADGSEIGEIVKDGLSHVYDIISYIALPVATIALAVCAFKIWTGGERGMEQAKVVAIYTVAGLAIIYLSPLIVQKVAGWFSPDDVTFDSLNPLQIQVP